MADETADTTEKKARDRLRQRLNYLATNPHDSVSGTERMVASLAVYGLDRPEDAEWDKGTRAADQLIRLLAESGS